MRQPRSDLNADSAASRRNRRPVFTVAAGLIALAIAAVVVVEERGGHASLGTDPAYSSMVPLAASAAQSSPAVTNTMSAGDSAKPHFERSNEPAYEDTVHPYGG